MATKPIEYAPKKLGGGYAFPVDDVAFKKRDTYRGNILVRGADVLLDLTDEQADELVKCADDPVYFIRTYCRITSVDEGIIPFHLYDYQEEVIQAYYENRFSLVCMARQMGKCVTGDTTIHVRNDSSNEEYNIPMEVYHESIKKPNTAPLFGANFTPIDGTVQDKFVENIELSGWSVYTDTGWQPITHTNKTIMFDVWEVVTEDGMTLKGADDHIVFTTNHNEVFVKDLHVGQLIATENGWSAIKSVVKTDRSEHMYDLSVDSPDHRYYTNGILSHNTAVVAAILLHYTLFNDAKVVAILANKESQAKEIVSRIRQMYEYLPFFLQQGAVSYNKKSVVFENRSEIFCAATGNESVRGRSCSVIYIDEAAFIANDNEFYESTYPVISSGEQTKIIMTSTPKGRRGMFFNLFEGADEDVSKSKNGYKKLLFTWKSDPRKNEAWKKTTIERFGVARFMQEFECVTGDTLITIRNKDTGQIFETTIENLCNLL